MAKPHGLTFQKIETEMLKKMRRWTGIGHCLSQRDPGLCLLHGHSPCEGRTGILTQGLLRGSSWHSHTVLIEV